MVAVGLCGFPARSAGVHGLSTAAGVGLDNFLTGRKMLGSPELTGLGDREARSLTSEQLGTPRGCGRWVWAVTARSQRYDPAHLSEVGGSTSL
jgi:hypothetical protein